MNDHWPIILNVMSHKLSEFNKTKRLFDANEWKVNLLQMFDVRMCITSRKWDEITFMNQTNAQPVQMVIKWRINRMKLSSSLSFQMAKLSETNYKNESNLLGIFFFLSFRRWFEFNFFFVQFVCIAWNMWIAAHEYAFNI